MTIVIRNCNRCGKAPKVYIDDSELVIECCTGVMDHNAIKAIQDWNEENTEE